MEKGETSLEFLGADMNALTVQIFMEM